MGLGDVIGGIAGGISNIITSGMNNAFSISAAQRNQRYAREQMAWEEKMSNTAYQRAIKDLKAAGLNPVLSAWNGGASTPGGASGSGTGATGADFLSGLQYKLEKDRVKNETDTTKQNIKESIQRTATNAKQAELYQKQIDQLEAETPAIQAEAQNKAEYLNSTIGGFLHKFGQGANDLAVPITALGGIAKGIIMAKGAKTLSSAMKAGKDYRSKTQQLWKGKTDYNKYDWSLAKPINVNFKGLK